MESPNGSVKIEFRTLFNPTYLRNNRSTGQKSLRCFPGCKERYGHVNQGFCGQSLRVAVMFSQSSSDIDFANILVLAQIHPTSQMGLSALGSHSRDDILGQVRVSTTQGGDLIIGNIESVTERKNQGCICEVTFNPNLHSWDYGWRSNRWSGVQETHVVEVSVLSSKDDVFNFIGGGKSSCFLIISNKKSRKKTATSSDDDSVLPEGENGTKPEKVEKEVKQRKVDKEPRLAKRGRLEKNNAVILTSAVAARNTDYRSVIQPSNAAYDADIQDAILALAILRSAPMVRPSNYAYDVHRFTDAQSLRLGLGCVDGIDSSGLYADVEARNWSVPSVAPQNVGQNDGLIIMPAKNC